jgi:hypothetical protein
MVTGGVVVVTGKIFINYRRGDDAGFTGRLFDFLERNFPSDRLFIDVDSIPAGSDFVQVLEAQVDQCDVMLSVIGRGWLEARDETGRRRLENSDDFVRIEIDTALKLGKRVIPVLVNGADMPRSEVLPVALQAFARRNAVRLTHERFRTDAQGLVHAIEVALREVEAAAKAAREAAAAEARHQAEQARLDAIEAKHSAKGTPKVVNPPIGSNTTPAAALSGSTIVMPQLGVGNVAVATPPAGFIRSPKDLVAGILFLTFGVASYEVTPGFDSAGTTIKFVPRLLAFMMLAFGALSFTRAFLFRGPSFDRIRWQPLVLLPAACILSGVILPYSGMPFALCVIGVMSATATPGQRFDWLSLLGYGIAMTVAFAMFSFILNIPLPVTGLFLKW